MKKMIVSTLSLALLTIVSLSYMNGPANRGHDKTGSPLSNGGCMDCHSSGAFSPGLTIKMLEGDNEVNTFNPGQSYTLRYHLLNTGSPLSFGFQTVILDENNENAGEFGELPIGFQISELNGISYLEHLNPSPVSSFEIEWTAPENADNPIKIYAGSVASNSNNNTGGDGADTTSLILTPNTSGLDFALTEKTQFFSIMENPVKDYLNLEISSNDESGEIMIFSQNQMIFREVLGHKTFDKIKMIDISTFPQGIYFVTINGSSGIQSEKFLKL